MTSAQDVDGIRSIVAVLRITLGVILLATWYENLTKGLYTAEGITNLFTHPVWGIFSEGGGMFLGYDRFINATVLRAPGAFAMFQMVAEFLLGLGLLLGAFTTLAGLGSTLFFFNLFLSYFGSMEWIWVYVLLTVSALVVALVHSGRRLGLDQYLVNRWGEPPVPVLW